MTSPCASLSWIGGIGFEHEPLRPVALLLVLLRENDAQQLLGRPVMLERQEQLQRALADVARAPCGARILLEAMRRREVDHGVVRQPREDRIDGLGVALRVPDPNAARNLAPGAIGSIEHARGIDVSGIFRRPALPRASHPSWSRPQRRRTRSSGACGSPRRRRCDACRRGRAVHRRRRLRSAPACWSPDDRRRPDSAFPTGRRDRGGRRSSSVARRSPSDRQLANSCSPRTR